MLAPWIISHFPEHRTYVEPFGGGASVLLRKKRAYSEVYNDLDGEIVNLFRVMRDPGRAAQLEAALRLTPFARTEFIESYELAEDPIEQARRTIARSFMGFGSPSTSGINTGFRANSSRSGTTPAHDWAHFPDCIAPMVDRLRGVVIENRDAVEVMLQHDAPATLFYLDPPYPHSTRSSKGYRYEMTDADHRRIAEVLRDLRGMVIISGYPCPLYDEELFRDWRRIERRSWADGARARVEVLWFSPNTPAVGAELPL